MISTRTPYIENFLDNLHNGEYTIDPRANDIPCGNSNLAHELDDALKAYEDSKPFTSGIGLPGLATRAYSMITSALSHGVVIRKNDVVKKLRDAENLLEKREDINEKLKLDNDRLRKKLVKSNGMKMFYRTELLKLGWVGADEVDDDDSNE